MKSPRFPVLSEPEPPSNGLPDDPDRGARLRIRLLEVAAVRSGGAARGEGSANIGSLRFAVATEHRVEVVQVTRRGVGRQVTLQGGARRACRARFPTPGGCAGTTDRPRAW